MSAEFSLSGGDESAQYRAGDSFAEEMALARRLLALPHVWVGAAEREVCESLLKPDAAYADLADHVAEIYERVERELYLNGKGALLRA